MSTERREPKVVLIGLGSNIDPETHLVRAGELLRERGGSALDWVSASTVWESAPVGAPGSPPFLNAVLRADSSLGPRTLKFDLLRDVERRLGRRRERDRNAPRTLDLDLLLYAGMELADADLTLPDPELATQPHLAVPAAEVAGELTLPGDGRTLSAIAAGLDSRLVARPGLELIRG